MSRWLIPLLAVTPLFAQQFEVASVKLTPDDGATYGYLNVRGGPGTNDPSRIAYTGVIMKRLIEVAFNLKQYEVTGPDWIESHRYNIDAKVPEGATRDQVPAMLQHLLIERFRLETHREAREVSSYNLVLGKNGLQIKNSKVPESALPGFNYTPVPGGSRLTARQLRIGGLAGLLSMQLRAPVFDKTGLTGAYDFVLEFVPELPMAAAGQPTADSQAPPLRNAIQDQLGLRLDPVRASIQILVVDKANVVPTDNLLP